MYELRSANGALILRKSESVDRIDRNNRRDSGTGVSFTLSILLKHNAKKKHMRHTKSNDLAQTMHTRSYYRNYGINVYTCVCVSIHVFIYLCI